MKTVNRIILLGEIISNPILKKDGVFKSVSFTIKTKDFYGSKEERKVSENFHSIVMWNSICGTSMEILSKGDSIYIEGKQRTTNIEGIPFTKVEIVVESWTKINTNARRPETNVE